MSRVCSYCGKTEEEVNISDVKYGLYAEYENICDECYMELESKKEK